MPASGGSLVFNLVAQAQQFKETINDALNYVKRAVESTQKYNATQMKHMTQQFTKDMTKSVGAFQKQMAKSINSKTLLGHFSEGLGMIGRGFTTLTGYISKAKFMILNLGKLVFTVLKSPFTILSSIINKVREGLLGLFKVFEWIQYQIFMQFMNIWLLAKTILPVLETFIEYNREIYNTWAIIGTMWDESFATLKEGISSLTSSGIEDIASQLGTTQEALQGVIDTIKQDSYDLGQYLSDLGKNIAQAFGQVPKDVASAFYQLASATVAFEDLQESAELAAQAAVAGVTTISEAVKGGVQAVYGFGMQMKELTDVYNMQFTTIRYGILRYEDLVKVMGRVYQPAASLSNSLANMKEMYATIAFVTRVGLSPEMGAFGLARLYEALSKPAIVKNLKAIGVAIYDLKGNFKGLYSLAQDLTSVFKGFTVQTQQKLLTNIGFDMRAVRVLRSMINNFTVYRQVLHAYMEDIESAAEGTAAFQEAFKRMQESVAFQMDKLKAAWETLKIDFIEKTLSAITYFVERLNSIFNSLLFTLKYSSISIGKFTISIADLVKTTGSFYTMFAILASVSGAISGLMHPIGLIIASFILLTNQARKSTEFFETFSDKFPVLGRSFEILGEYVSVFVGVLKTSENPVKAFAVVVQHLFKDLGAIMEQDSFIKDVISAGKDFWKAMSAIFNPSKAQKIMMEFMQKTGTYFDSYTSYLGYSLGKLIGSVGKLLGSFIASMLGIDMNAEDIANKGITLVTNIIKRIYKAIMSVFAGLFGRINIKDYGLKDLAIDIAKKLGLVIEDGFNNVIISPNAIDALGNIIRSVLISAVKYAVANLDTFIMPIIGLSVLRSMIAGISSALAGVGGGFGLGGVLKLTAVLYFADVIFGSSATSTATKVFKGLGFVFVSTIAMQFMKLLSKGFLLKSVASLLVMAISNPILTLVTILGGLTAGIIALANSMKNGSANQAPPINRYKGTPAEVIESATRSPILSAGFLYSKESNIDEYLAFQMQQYIYSVNASFDELIDTFDSYYEVLDKGSSEVTVSINRKTQELKKTTEETKGFWGTIWEDMKRAIFGISEDKMNKIIENAEAEAQAQIEKQAKQEQRVVFDFTNFLYKTYAQNLIEATTIAAGDSANYLKNLGVIYSGDIASLDTNQIKELLDFNLRLIPEEPINIPDRTMDILTKLFNKENEYIKGLIDTYNYIGQILLNNNKYVSEFFGDIDIDTFASANVIDISNFKDSTLNVVDFLKGYIVYLNNVGNWSEEQMKLRDDIDTALKLYSEQFSKLTFKDLFEGTYKDLSAMLLFPTLKPNITDAGKLFIEALQDYTSEGKKYVIDLIDGWDKSIWQSTEAMATALKAIKEDVQARMVTYTTRGADRQALLMSEVNRSIFSDYLAKVYEKTQYATTETSLGRVLKEAKEVIGKSDISFDETVNTLFEMVREEGDKAKKAAELLTQLIDAATLQLKEILSPEEYLEFLKKRDLMFADLFSVTSGYSESKKLFATTIASLQIYSAEIVDGQALINDLTSEEFEGLMALYDEYEAASKAYLDLLNQGESSTSAAVVAAKAARTEALKKLRGQIAKDMPAHIKTYAKRVMFELGSRALEEFINSIQDVSFNLNAIKIYDAKTKKLFDFLPNMTIDLKTPLEQGLELILKSQVERIESIAGNYDVGGMIASILADTVNITPEEVTNSDSVLSGIYIEIKNKVDQGGSLISTLLEYLPTLGTYLSDEAKAVITKIGEAYNLMLDKLDDSELRNLAESYFGADLSAVVDSVALYGVDAANKFIDNLTEMLTEIQEVEQEISNTLNSFDITAIPEINYEGYSIDTIIDYAKNNSEFRAQVADVLNNDYLLMQDLTKEFTSGGLVDSLTKSISAEEFNGDVLKDLLKGAIQSTFPELNTKDIENMTNSWIDRFRQLKDTANEQSADIRNSINNLLFDFVKSIFGNLISLDKLNVDKYVKKASKTSTRVMKAKYSLASVNERIAAVPTLDITTKLAAQGLPTGKEEYDTWFKEAIKDIPTKMIQRSEAYFDYVETELKNMLLRAIRVLETPNIDENKKSMALDELNFAMARLTEFESFAKALSVTMDSVTNSVEEATTSFEAMASVFKKAVGLVDRGVNVFSKNIAKFISITSYKSYISSINEELDEFNSFFDYMANAILYGLTRTNAAFNKMLGGAGESVVSFSIENLQELSTASILNLKDVIVSVLDSFVSFDKFGDKLNAKAIMLKKQLDKPFIFRQNHIFLFIKIFMLTILC